MRRKPADQQHRRGGREAPVEPGPDGEMAVGRRSRRIVHRQLHHVHPEQDVGDAIAAGEEFGGCELDAEHHRRREDKQRIGVERANARPQDHQHPDKAKHHRTYAAACQAFTQKGHRHQQSPGRRGEFQREHGGQGQHHHAIGPTHLGGAMHHIAQQMQLQRPGRANATAPATPQTQHHHAAEAAQGQDLEHRQRRRQRADRHRQGAERQQRPTHPQNDEAKVTSGSGHFGISFCSRWRRPDRNGAVAS